MSRLNVKWVFISFVPRINRFWRQRWGRRLTTNPQGAARVLRVGTSGPVRGIQRGREPTTSIFIQKSVIFKSKLIGIYVLQSAANLGFLVAYLGEKIRTKGYRFAIKSVDCWPSFVLAYRLQLCVVGRLSPGNPTLPAEVWIFRSLSSRCSYAVFYYSQRRLDGHARSAD